MNKIKKGDTLICKIGCCYLTEGKSYTAIEDQIYGGNDSRVSIIDDEGHEGEYKLWRFNLTINK